MNVPLGRYRAHLYDAWYRADKLLLILLLAFTVRFAISWHPGYGFDTGVYMGWAQSAVELGLAESYTKQVGNNMLPNYPPLSMLMLTVAGHTYKWFIAREFDVYATNLLIFIKLPGILADVMICLLLSLFIRQWKNEKSGLLAALIYALHPAAIFDTAVWGQTDSIYTFFMVAALGFWVMRHELHASAVLALSLLTKLQAIVLFPLFFFLTCRNLKLMLRFTIIGCLTTLLVLAPFLVSNAAQDVVNVYINLIGSYSNVAVGAYNFWWSLLADRAWQLQDTALLFGTISYKHAGLILFGTLYALILFVFRRPLFEDKDRDIGALFFCAALLCHAFFLFLTQMHERYMFPFVALGIPLVFMSKRLATYYFIASIAFWINLMGVLPFTFIDTALYQQFDILDGFVAATQVWMFILMLGEAWVLYSKKAV